MRAVIAILIGLMFAPAVRAQQGFCGAGGNDQSGPPAAPPTPRHTGVRALVGNLGEDIKHLPAIENVYIAAIGGAAAAAIHPADNSFNQKLLSHRDGLDDLFVAGKYIGSVPAQVALSVGTYALARWQDQPKAAHLGMDLLQAQIVTAMIVQPLKLAVHRAGPNASDHQSFPSGHATVTFAGATVVERHLGWRKAALAYAIASYVSSSRLHDNVHYASDVAFGAAVGVMAGRTVVHHAADYWAVMPVPVPGGIGVVVTRLGSSRTSGPFER